MVAVARELAGFIWDISRLAMSLAMPREGRQHEHALSIPTTQLEDEFPEGGVARHTSNPRAC